MTATIATPLFHESGMYFINDQNQIKAVSTAGFDEKDYVGYRPTTISELYDIFGVQESDLCEVGYICNDYGSPYCHMYVKDICDKYGVEIPEPDGVWDQVHVFNTLDEAVESFKQNYENEVFTKAFHAFMRNGLK